MKTSDPAKALEQAAAVLRMRFVEHDGGDLADVGVDRESEEKQLQHGDEQREEERAGVADDVQELFPANRNETAKEGASSLRLLHDAVGEGDEDVFERRLDGLDLRLRKFRAEVGEMIGLSKRVDGVTEDGGFADAGHAAHAVEDLGRIGRADLNARRAGWIGVGKSSATRRRCRWR